MFILNNWLLWFLELPCFGYKKLYFCGKSRVLSVDNATSIALK